MKKYYIELQDEPKACGAYCIYMILKNKGIHIELKSIKEKCRMDENGISIKGLLECLKEYQVEAKAYEASLDDIKENVILPCILHLNVDGYGHYVVLFEIHDDEYIIGDPAQGLITLYKEEIEQLYSSMMISILHIGRVPDDKEKDYFQFVKESFQLYLSEVFHFLLSGISISFFSFIASFMFQIIIDVINIKTPYFYMAMLSVAYIIIELLRLAMEKHQNIHLVELQRVLDEDYVLSPISHLVDLPMSFYHQSKAVIHSQLLSLYQLSEMSTSLFENILLHAIIFILFSIGLFFIQPILTGVILIMFIVIVIYMRYTVPHLKKISKNHLEKYYQHHQTLLEYIENIFVLKRFDVKNRKNDYHNIYIDYALSKEDKEKKSIIMNSFISIMIQIAFFVILIIGLWFYSYKKISLGNLVTFYMLVQTMIPSFLSLVSLSFEYQQMKLIYERYKNFQYQKVEKEKIKDSIKRITLDNVSYSYGYRQNLFEHVDLDIEKTLYVKGSSGSGKSTFLRLLMGNDLHYNGDIYFNDQELRDIDLSSLYEHIGYECDTPTFFRMSLYDNFLIDDRKKILSLLKSFGYSFLEDQFKVVLNEDGSPLSSGERQVVALIRLFLRDYDVYILDEVFSHMDTRSAGRIYRYIVKNYSDKILIMVNHQTKLVNRNDDYVIIDKGKLKKKDD